MVYTVRLTEEFQLWLDDFFARLRQAKAGNLGDWASVGGEVSALGDVARARGMAQVAKDTGLGRESLYKALAPGAKPRFDKVLKVARALVVKLTAQTS
jgi:probable addiction module antidote protein